MKWLLFSAPRLLTQVKAAKEASRSKLGTRTPDCFTLLVLVSYGTNPCVDYEPLNPQVLTYPNLMGLLRAASGFWRMLWIAGCEVQGFKDLRLQISAAQPGYLTMSVHIGSYVGSP